MMFRQIRNAMVLAGLAVVFISAPAWAISNNSQVMPAPGVLGLVAIGIIGAIALARLRK